MDQIAVCGAKAAACIDASAPIYHQVGEGLLGCARRFSTIQLAVSVLQPRIFIAGVASPACIDLLLVITAV